MCNQMDWSDELNNVLVNSDAETKSQKECPEIICCFIPSIVFYPYLFVVPRPYFVEGMTNNIQLMKIWRWIRIRLRLASLWNVINVSFFTKSGLYMSRDIGKHRRTAIEWKISRQFLSEWRKRRHQLLAHIGFEQCPFESAYTEIAQRLWRVPKRE